MKTSTVGIFSAAILIVMAGLGFGIAQAVGNHTDDPVLSFEDQEAPEQTIVSNTHARVLPSGSGMGYDSDGNPTKGMAQGRGPVETGAIPATGLEESWMKDYGND